jgi:hypothetical protein
VFESPVGIITAAIFLFNYSPNLRLYRRGVFIELFLDCVTIFELDIVVPSSLFTTKSIIYSVPMSNKVVKGASEGTAVVNALIPKLTVYLKIDTRVLVKEFTLTIIPLRS